MTRLRLRLNFETGHVFGPGKADLLAYIQETGSIAKAANAMNMSYKRAWSLVDEMNEMFSEPLVSTQRGGAGRGGAALTENGIKMLGYYREIELRAMDAGRAPLEAMEAGLNAE